MSFVGTVPAIALEVAQSLGASKEMTFTPSMFKSSSPGSLITNELELVKVPEVTVIVNETLLVPVATLGMA